MNVLKKIKIKILPNNKLSFKNNMTHVYGMNAVQEDFLKRRM